MKNSQVSKHFRTSRQRPKLALYLRLKNRKVFNIVKKGDRLGFLKLQFVAKYQKFEGGPFGDKKNNSKKVKGGTLQSRPVLYLPLKM